MTARLHVPGTAVGKPRVKLSADGQSVHLYLDGSAAWITLDDTGEALGLELAMREVRELLEARDAALAVREHASAVTA